MNLSINPGEVHVHVIHLDWAAPSVAQVNQFLSDEERARADRFQSSRDGARFRIAHGQVRVILARYANRDPASLLFDYDENGKPSLRGSAIHFNLSHCDAIA